MIKRALNISSYIKNNKSILILGPRGTGKTFFCNEVLKNYKNIISVNLLKSGDFKLYLNNKELIYKETEYNVKKENLIYFVDEVQLIPDLLNEVHRTIETFKNKVCFILTGSSARKLRKTGVNLLAGRLFHIPFFTFSFDEIDFEEDFNRVLQFGLLPEAYLENDFGFREEYLKTYSHTYLKEEILQEALVRNVEAFSKFLELAADINGAPTNFTKIAKMANVATKTIQDYYSILEDTLIATKIPGWSYSKRKQLQKAPKYYFFDNGIINSLTGDLKAEILSSSYRFGKLFENLVVNEMIKYNASNKFGYSFYYYRTNTGVEIDLIIQKSLKDNPIAIEIKSSQNPDFNSVKSLLTFKEEYPSSKLYVLCRTNTPYIDNNIEFLPYKEGIKKIFV